MIVTLSGAFPRLSDQPGGTQFVRVERAWRQGLTSAEVYERACQSAIRDAVRKQEEAGLTLICDGEVRSPDPLSLLIGGLDGIEAGSLARYFDTNTYFRRPRIVAPVRWERPLKLADTQIVRQATILPVKVILPGPYTAACLAQDSFYGDRAGLGGDLALALNQEARYLAELGVAELQFDEPCVTGAGADIGLARRLWRRLLSGVACGRAVYFGFGRATPEACQAALDAGFDCLGLDFTLPDPTQQLGTTRPPRLAAGIVDARRTLLEDAALLLQRVHQALQVVGREHVYLNPNLRLDLLPLDAAMAKLRRLVEAAACT